MIEIDLSDDALSNDEHSVEPRPAERPFRESFVFSRLLAHPCTYFDANSVRLDSLVDSTRVTGSNH